MQIYGTATSPLRTGIDVGSGASKYTDIVTKCVNTLATGSGASVTDQLNAYQTLASLIFSGDGEGNGGVLQQANQNDFQRALTSFENSDISQKISQVSGQFGEILSSTISSEGTNPNIAQCNLDTLSRFSQDDQQIIFAASNLNIPGAIVVGGQSLWYARLDDWKSGLKQQAAVFFVQQQAPTAATTSSTLAPTTSSIARVAAKPPSLTGPTSLTTAGAPLTTANIALQVLLSDQPEAHADARAASNAAAKTGTMSNLNHDISGIATARDATASASASSTGHLNQLA